jgi:hypothetical protein
LENKIKFGKLRFNTKAFVGQFISVEMFLFGLLLLIWIDLIFKPLELYTCFLRLWPTLFLNLQLYLIRSVVCLASKAIFS